MPCRVGPSSLYGFAGKKAVVLVFLGTDCPLANVYAPRLAELNREYRGKGVAFLGINSNAHETEAAIGEQARKYGLDFPVLKDPRNVVADLALVERTPEVLVLDGRARVRYRGAIDDQYATETRKPQASQALPQRRPRRPARRPVRRGDGDRCPRVPARPGRASPFSGIQVASPPAIGRRGRDPAREGQGDVQSTSVR